MLGIPAESTILGYAAQFVPHKGFFRFLECAARLMEESPAVSCLVAGVDLYRSNRYARKAREFGFRAVASGVFVRSSYRAAEALTQIGFSVRQGLPAFDSASSSGMRGLAELNFSS